MAPELETTAGPAMSAPEKRKRKQHQRKGKMADKKMRISQRGAVKRRNPTERMKKLFRKRARDYDSDNSSEEEEEEEEEEEADEEERGLDAGVSDTYGEEEEEEEDDDNRRRHAVGTKLVEGSRAFRIAFTKIMKLNLPEDDPLGPILSAHKKLVAEKLAEEEEEHKAKKAAKKEKQLAMEKGHVKPANFLDAKEKSLIGIATKGVVKLFNAVSKAQIPQKGLNPSRSKDAKVLAKQRKQAFFSELRKSVTQIPGSTSNEKNDEPGWAPLRDNYMLTNSKLKDWDKMTAHATVAGQEGVSMASSSDED